MCAVSQFPLEYQCVTVGTVMHWESGEVVNWCEVLYREGGRDSTPLSVNRSTNHHSIGTLISKSFFHNVLRSQNIPRNKTSVISTTDTRVHTCISMLLPVPVVARSKA